MIVVLYHIKVVGFYKGLRDRYKELDRPSEVRDYNYTGEVKRILITNAP